MFSARAERRGAISVLAAVLMVFLLCVVAFATELGYILVVRTQLQTAADSASLAAAASLRDGTSAAAKSADTFGESNKAGGASVSVNGDDIEMGHWSNDGGWTPEAQLEDDEEVNAVRVTCRMTTASGNPLGLNLARMFGLTHVDLSATATAKIKPPPCSKIIGLTRVTMSGTAYTDSYSSSDGAYSPGSAGSGGTVCSNGPILGSGSPEINGDAHPGVGQSVLGTVTVTGDTEPLTDTLNYPPIDLGDVASSNDNTSIPLTSLGRNPVNAAGVFMLMQNESVTLPSGTYYFKMVNLLANSSLNIDGEVVIYCNGNCYTSGGSVLNASQNPKNLQIYSTGTIVTVSGYSDFYGMVYAPGASVSRSGSTDFYGMVIGNYLTLSGTGGVHADESITQIKGVKYQSILVE